MINAEMLLLTVASAQIKAMQVVQRDGCTAFQRLHGIPPPNTVRCLLEAGKLDPVKLQHELQRAPQDDHSIIHAIADTCDELIEYHIAKADQRSRYNLFNNLAKQANLQHTDFGFSAGQAVSIEGQPHEVVSYTPLADSPPTTVTVKAADGTVKVVRTSKLRPLCIDRPEVSAQTRLPQSNVDHIAVDTLIFFEDPDHECEGLLAGVVTNVLTSPLSYEVQLHAPAQARC